MAELAPVKVALLDIGKEQRTKKQKQQQQQKKNQMRHRMVPDAMRPVRQSGNLHHPADTSTAAALQILTLIELPPAGS